MEQSHTDNCVLRLNHLVFDKISFKRKGFANENSVKYQFGFAFQETGKRDFAAHVEVSGKKKGEYTFTVCASGYFTVDGGDRGLLMRQNAVAIIFPYIRSQISLLTAQPEMAPVVLPPLNIAQMVEEAMRRAEEDG